MIMLVKHLICQSFYVLMKSATGEKAVLDLEGFKPILSYTQPFEKYFLYY